MVDRIHQDNKVLTHGTPLEEAKVAMLLMHGRGASAEDMLKTAVQLPSDGIAYLMPQATQNVWYPNSGFGAFEANEPFLSSAWATIDERLVDIQAAGIPIEKIIIGGFSQGACLMSEYVVRNTKRYGAVLNFSGALMGPADTPRDYDGSLEGTAVWVGGADNDPWMQAHQQRETADVFKKLGADVSTKVHHSSDHMIRQSDIDAATRMINALVAE